MKVPSLIRLPKYKSFDYTPRHYDPVKEEIKERTERIKHEIQEGTAEDFNSTIAGSFRRKSENSLTGVNYSSSLLQLIIALVLLGTFVGYLFYGNQIFYVLMLGVPVYLYFRLKGVIKKKRPE